MQNDYIHALFSYLVYENPTENLPFGWEPFTNSFSSITAKDNFYAFAFINKSLKKIIIAFRGTDTLENVIIEDVFEIAFNKSPSLFANHAVPYVNTVRTVALNQYPDFEISFTGHSLGAILAELCAAMYKMRAITFESPGSKNMIIDLLSEKLLPPQALSTAEEYVMSYQADISSINRHNAYVGKRIRLYPEPPLINAPLVSLEYATPFVEGCGTLDLPRPSIFGQYSGQQHHMKELLAQFDPDEGALVYSIYPSQEMNDNSHGYLFAYNNWLNYDENRHYWDQAIEKIYFPICGRHQTLQAYKENYIQRGLFRKINAYEQTGITIYAPGSSHYPALTIWGTTNHKDTLIFGKGKFKVIAYGFNTYKFSRDAQVSCDVEQRTLDSNRESVLLIGEQSTQGYALNYNTPSKFKSTLYLSNDLKVRWTRTPGETKDTYQISIGDREEIADPEFAMDYPAVRFSNSPAGQFNILSGEVYQYNEPSYFLAASSAGFIYKLIIKENKNQAPYYVLYQQTLAGNIINKTTINFNSCPQLKYDYLQNEFPTMLQLYEESGTLHLYSQTDCKYSGLPPASGYDFWECSDYTNIFDNGELVLSCGGVSKCKDKTSYLLPSFHFDDFKSSFACDSMESTTFMKLMQYTLRSGNKFVTTNPEILNDESDSIAGVSEAYIVDKQNNRLFTFKSPLTQNQNHFYAAGAILSNDDTLMVGFKFNYYFSRALPALAIDTYSIYWETSSLAYFKCSGTSTPVSTFVSSSPDEIPNYTFTMIPILTCMQLANMQGFVNAINNMASNTAAEAGYSESTIQKGSQLLYLTSMLCVQLYLQETLENTAKDILILLTVNIILSRMKHMFDWLSQYCERNQWHQTSEILKQISDLVEYAAYGYHFYKDSAVETVAAITTGVATQKAVEFASHRVATTFFKSSKKTFLSRDVSEEENKFFHQSLSNPQTNQPNYHSLSDPTSATSLGDQKSQRSAHVALSINNKNQLNQFTTEPANDKASTKNLCAVM